MRALLDLLKARDIQRVGLRDFRRSMDRDVPEIHERFHVVERPTAVGTASLMPGVRAHRRVARIG